MEYQEIRTKAQESLKQQCSHAYLKDGIILNDKDGRVSVNPDSIYCDKIKESETLYTIDCSGKESGIFVIMKEHRCEHPRDMSRCLLKNL